MVGIRQKRRRRRRWELIDLGSTNGTFVNNSRISGAALLRDGQDVRFGSARLVFRRTAQSQLKGARTFRPSLYRRFFRVRTAIELIIVAFVVGFAVTQYLSYVNYRHLAETRSSASKLAPSPGPPPVSKATPVREAPPIRRGPPESSVSDKVPSWLKRLNYWRTMANMPAVSENLELSEGARRHSRYLVKHALQGDSGWLQGADMHSEDSRDPWYTPAGLAAGKNGDVDPPCQGCLLISDVQHLDIFLDAPFHRFRALDPDALGSWPLAITAYNYGTGGTLAAAAEYGGDYDCIVRNYNGPHFGFAVRNYYSEFLAALQIHQDEDKYFPDLKYSETPQPPPVRTDFTPPRRLAHWSHNGSVHHVIAHRSHHAHRRGHLVRQARNTRQVNGGQGVVAAVHHPHNDQNRKAVVAEEQTSGHDS